MSHENKEISGNDYQVFDKPPAHVDHEKSLRSAQQTTVEGKCPNCGYEWLHPTNSEKNRRLYVFEVVICASCSRQIMAVPFDPSQPVPEMVENPWKKAERLEEELAGAKHEIEYLTNSRDDVVKDAERLNRELAETRKQRDTACQTQMEIDQQYWVKVRDELLGRSVALENQLAESRRNFAIIAKILRGTK